METKKDIRKRVFAKREEYTDAQINEMSLQVKERLEALPEYRDAPAILVYVDFNHEVVTRGMIEDAWKAGKRVAVPKCVGREMVFYQLENFDQLEKGYFGILEPARGEIVQWEDALMIMPGVAFNSRRHRVGYGGGFYDRYLEQHPIHTVAIAFEFQMIEDVPIPVEETDILPEIIVTEKKVYQ